MPGPNALEHRYGEKVFTFNLRVTGRLHAPSREIAEAKVRNGLCFNLMVHDAIDDLVIGVSAPESFEDLKEGLK
jgi:hypothetical protein